MKLYIICDDIPVNNFILHKMLEVASEGDDKPMIIQTTSGHQCIEQYNDMISSGYTPNAIFLDFCMPVCHGGLVTQMLRSTYNGIISYVTTMKEDDPQLEEWRKYANYLIPKPIRLEQLKEIIK
jgi:CheY-like chemotaxis protein